jgi:hypothetical protein
MAVQPLEQIQESAPQNNHPHMSRRGFLRIAALTVASILIVQDRKPPPVVGKPGSSIRIGEHVCTPSGVTGGPHCSTADLAKPPKVNTDGRGEKYAVVYTRDPARDSVCRDNPDNILPNDYVQSRRAFEWIHFNCSLY